MEMPSLNDKATLGITRRLISPRVHRRGGLAPRWLIDPGAEFVPRVCRSPPKRYASRVQNVVRQFGPYLSWANKGAVPSTRGPGWTHLWCTSCHASGNSWYLCAERINAEGICVDALKIRYPFCLQSKTPEDYKVDRLKV